MNKLIAGTRPVCKPQERDRIAEFSVARLNSGRSASEDLLAKRSERLESITWRFRKLPNFTCLVEDVRHGKNRNALFESVFLLRSLAADMAAFDLDRSARLHATASRILLDLGRPSAAIDALYNAVRAKIWAAQFLAAFPEAFGPDAANRANARKFDAAAMTLDIMALELAPQEWDSGSGLLARIHFLDATKKIERACMMVAGTGKLPDVLKDSFIRAYSKLRVHVADATSVICANKRDADMLEFLAKFPDVRGFGSMLDGVAEKGESYQPFL